MRLLAPIKKINRVQKNKCWLWALLTLVIYCAIAAGYYNLAPQGAGLFAFVHPGIEFDPAHTLTYHQLDHGYDGQFFYTIAVYGGSPLTKIDNPPYRYARIIYPLLARTLAFGQSSLVPITLLGINLVIIPLSVWLMGLLFLRRGLPPALALLYAFWPGTLTSFVFDLSEPLCFFFVLGAFALFKIEPRNEPISRTLGIAILLLLACLTKELALLFVAGFGLSYLVAWRWRACLILACLVGLPYLAWQVYLSHRFGQMGLAAGQGFNYIPFGGLIFNTNRSMIERYENIFLVAIPTFLLFFVVVYRLWRGDRHAAIFCLAIYVLFLFFMPAASYYLMIDCTRNATGLFIALAMLTPPVYLASVKYQKVSG